MADSLDPVPRGSVSPFVTSFSTVNRSLALLRQFNREQGQGFNGVGAQDSGPLSPATRVIVRNDTTLELLPTYIVKLGDNVTAMSGDDMYGFHAHPIFKGTVPAATTDRFAILEEGADYPGGGDYSYARAVVQGHAVAMVNITDTGHLYATPTAGDRTKMTSAASGPALILAKDGTGTGVKVCSLLLTQVDPGAATAGTMSFSSTGWGSASDVYSVTGTGTWSYSGYSVSISTAGLYLVSAHIHAKGALTGGLGFGGKSCIWAMLADNAGTNLDSSGCAICCAAVGGNSSSFVHGAGTGTIVLAHRFTGSETIKLYARKDAAYDAGNGQTWSFSTIYLCSSGATPIGPVNTGSIGVIRLGA